MIKEETRLIDDFNLESFWDLIDNDILWEKIDTKAKKFFADTHESPQSDELFTKSRYFTIEDKQRAQTKFDAIKLRVALLEKQVKGDQEKMAKARVR